MSITVEQLKARWKNTDAPGCFDKDAVNWTDLSIATDLGPVLAPIMIQAGYSPAKLEDLPTLLLYGPRDQKKHFGVRTVEELPEYTRNCGANYTVETIVENAFSKSIKPLLDPAEKLFFVKPGATPHSTTAIAIHNREYAVSEYWRTQWGLQLDTVVGIDEDLTEGMAASLVAPQTVRNELADRQNRVFTINAESITGDGGHHFWFPRMLVDGHLIYSQYIVFNREGEYPIAEDKRPEVSKAIAGVIGKIVTYDETYRNNLLNVYRAAFALGVNIETAFAAKEV